jgi:membrane associated rhomboid family serine protease
MLIVIPIGHDRQVVNRLPLVTFTLIALNLAFFLATLAVNTRQEARLETALKSLMDYIEQHPDVTLSSEAEDRLARLPFGEEIIEQVREMLHKRRANYNQAMIHRPSVFDEQPEMDRLAKNFVEAYDGFWLFKYGFVPRYHKSSLFNYLSCMFLHGGWMHLIGNMLFLYLAGMAIEDLWGRGLYTGFYLLSGLAATVAHFAFNMNSTIPTIGASGAIAGLMGAFMVRHFKARVKLAYLYWFFFRFKAGTTEIPAYVVLPFWLAEQLFYATIYQALGVNGGVAFWAHIGGFAFGAAIAAGLYHGRIEEKYIAPKLEAKLTFGANRTVTEALEALDKDQSAVALRKLTQRAQLAPDDTDALAALTTTYAKLGQRKEEIETYFNLIRGHLKKNDREAALNAYGSLLDTYPEGEEQRPLPAREWMVLCDYLGELGMHKESVGEYEKLVRAYPNEVFAAKALICAAEICMTQLNDHQRAKELFKRAAEIAPAAPAWRTRIAAGLTQIEAAESSARF